MTEASFQAEVVALVESVGGACYHTHDSRRSPAGFPDLVIWLPRRLHRVDGRLRATILHRELKTDTGRTTPEQEEWLRRFELAGMDAGVWRPRDMPRIRRELGLVEETEPRHPLAVAARAEGYGEHACRRVEAALARERRR